LPPTPCDITSATTPNEGWGWHDRTTSTNLLIEDAGLNKSIDLNTTGGITTELSGAPQQYD